MKIRPALDLHNSVAFSCCLDAWPNASSQVATPLASADFGGTSSSDLDPDFAALSRSAQAAADHRSEEYPLVAIVGPTASGKSSLALSLAQNLNGEVINYDSVQVFRGMDAGSGKLPPGERLGIPHHLLDIALPGRIFTAGEYRRLAIETLHEVKRQARLPILVGGTGFYLRALLHGLFEGPARSEQLRTRLCAMAKRRGRGFLHRLLARLDTSSAARIHPNDTQKIIRAVEVCLLAGQPLSRLQSRGRKGLAGFSVLKIGLQPERRALYRRIDERTERMFASGLVEETRGLIKEYGEMMALTALGYREARAVVRDDLSLDEAVRATQAATRRYAKRQLTWLRHEQGVLWLRGFGDDPKIQQEAFERFRHAD